MPFITFHIKYRVANEVATARCHKTFFLPQKFQYLHREKEKKSKAQCWKKQSLENLVLFDNLQIQKKLFFVVKKLFLFCWFCSKELSNVR